MTTGQWIQQATVTLQAVSDSPHLDAELLVARTLDLDRGQLLARLDQELPSSMLRHLQTRLTERERGVPLAYIFGQQEFFGRQFMVTPDVLIPRPASELIVVAALDVMKKKHLQRVMDVGTGSGALAITLALEEPTATVIATDISAAALNVARMNAIAHGLQDRLLWRQGSLLEAVADMPHIEMIVANLPYLTPEQMEHPSIQFEPPLALAAGPDGLMLITKLLRQSLDRPELQAIILEFDPSQAQAIEQKISRSYPAWIVREIFDGQAVRGLVATST